MMLAFLLGPLIAATMTAEGCLEVRKPASRAALGEYSWNPRGTRLPVAVRLHVVDATPWFEAEVRRAWNEWKRVVGIRDRDPQAKVITARLVKMDGPWRLNPGDPFARGMRLAYAWLPGLPEQGNIHFDIDEDWGGRWDVFTIAAHEIGHALGLEHLAGETSIMRDYYLGPLRSLSSQDIVAIGQLYLTWPRPGETVTNGQFVGTEFGFGR